MKAFFKTLAHGFVSAAAMAAAASVHSGAPITSGNVLIPALAAGVFGMVHGAFPSSIGLDGFGSGQ